MVEKEKSGADVNSQIIEKLNNIELQNRKIESRIRKIELQLKQKKWKNLINVILTGVILTLIISTIVGIWVIPTWNEMKEREKQKNLEFILKTNWITVGDKDINFSYDFTGLNYNDEIWTNDVTLKLNYMREENYTLSVDILDNPQLVSPILKENTISFTWDTIPQEVDKTPGNITLRFVVHWHNPVGGGTYMNAETSPKYKIVVEDIGEFILDEKGVILFK